MEFSHRPVLLDECINALAIRADGVYVDGTAGGGGHSQEIAKRLTTGRLVACLLYTSFFLCSPQDGHFVFFGRSAVEKGKFSKTLAFVTVSRAAIKQNGSQE